MKPLTSPIAFSLLALTLVTSPASAAIIADFTAGNTSSAVDGYVGMAGNGWSGAWLTKTTNTTISSASVANTSPLTPTSGNYLAIQTSNAANAGNPAMSVDRQYGAAGGGVSLTSPTTFSFLFRPDIGSSADYRYYIFDASAASASTGPICTWTIAAIGGFWQVLNGDRTGGIASTITTPVAVTLGTTYGFTVTADPLTQTWGVTISDANGSSLYTKNSLGFRSTATSLGGYLAFGVADSNASTASSFGYSVDSIAIVPEPGVASLAALGLIGIAVTHFRRKA